MIKKYLSVIPIPMAGVALGIAALGNLIQTQSVILRNMCGIVSAILVTAVITKLFICHETSRKDFKNPIIASVSATICMSMMQLSVYAYPFMKEAAFILWCSGVILHLLLIVFYTGQFLIRCSLKEVYPTCFITYVGIIVASITSTTFHMEAIGHVLFWLGFAGYLIMLVIITMRYIRHEREESTKPLFCIYAAPMSLSLTGYLAIMPHPSLSFTILLEVLAQLLFLMVVLQLPKLLKLPFFPSYAAFTFPFVITSFALKKMLELFTTMHIQAPAILHIVNNIETMFAIILVTYTTIRFLQYILIQWNILHQNKQKISCKS